MAVQPHLGFGALSHKHAPSRKIFQPFFNKTSTKKNNLSTETLDVIHNENPELELKKTLDLSYEKKKEKQKRKRQSDASDEQLDPQIVSTTTQKEAQQPTTSSKKAKNKINPNKKLKKIEGKKKRKKGNSIFDDY